MRKKKTEKLQATTAYRGFQEPGNWCLAGGVEPPIAMALLAPATGVGEYSATSWEATSAVVPSFTAASLAAFSLVAASVATSPTTSL
jgi:hypothetical protein